MGIFSNRSAADIISDSALGAENMRQQYDNIALEREKKREAEARRQAEAEASAMAARANAATAQAKAAAKENDSLTAQLMDFKLAIDDVSNAINLPHLNLAWKAAQQTIALYSSRIDLYEGIVLLERRYRQVYQEVLSILEQEHGISHSKIATLIKQKYEQSCKSVDDKSIPSVIHEDKPEEFLFLDDKVKSLNRLRLTGNQLVDDLDETEKALANLQRVHAMRKAEEEIKKNAPR